MSKKRDHKLFSILSNNNRHIFKHINKSKKENASLNRLHVGKQVFQGDSVADGFYFSFKHLKALDYSKYSYDPCFSDYLLDYDLILKICKEKQMSIPPLSLAKSKEILSKLKYNVHDFYGISPEHYINAGHEGLLHFNTLQNLIISDLNNSQIEELNSVHARVLYKGHGKIKYSEKSYRCISTNNI